MEYPRSVMWQSTIKWAMPIAFTIMSMCENRAKIWQNWYSYVKFKNKNKIKKKLNDTESIRDLEDHHKWSKYINEIENLKDHQYNNS